MRESKREREREGGSHKYRYRSSATINSGTILTNASTVLYSKLEVQEIEEITKHKAGLK